MVPSRLEVADFNNATVKNFYDVHAAPIQCAKLSLCIQWRQGMPSVIRFVSLKTIAARFVSLVSLISVQQKIQMYRKSTVDFSFSHVETNLTLFPRTEFRVQPHNQIFTPGDKITNAV